MYPVSHVLDRAVRLFPNRTAIIDGPVQLTYRQLAERVRRLAAAFRSRGLERGDRVAIVDWNSHRYLETYYACAHAGLVLMPVNSRLTSGELVSILQDADARALLFSEPFTNLYVDVAASKLVETVIGLGLPKRPNGVLDYEEQIASAMSLRAPEPVELDAITLIYYTSGTTGEPKGVCLTNRNMYCGALDGLITLGAIRSDSWLHTGPLFHLATSWAVYAMPLIGAAQLVMHFDPVRAVDLMARENVTMTSMPGSILGMVADMVRTQSVDLPALRTIIYGGAPTPMGVLQKAFAALPAALTHVYGITELAGFVTTLLPADHVFEGPEKLVRRTASAGQAVPLVDVRVVDDNGQDVGVGEIGEIVCGGPKVMAGYWRKPGRTTEVIRNGWYHTGDMGILDEERFLTIVDRKKDMIISGGENVYSVEVESVISLHPDVLEVAIIGVPHPQWGEAVKAVIVPRAGVQSTAEDIIEFCRGRIAGYKIPKSVDFYSEPLPKTGPGKIAKRALRDPYWENSSGKI